MRRQWFVGQSLPRRSLDRGLGPDAIGVMPCVPPEAKLTQVAVQVFGADMMKRADQTALQKRVIRLSRHGPR